MGEKSPEERIGVVESEVKGLQREDGEIWKAIDDLRRWLRSLLPVWVAIVLSIMTGITCTAVTIAVLAVKFAGVIWKS